MDSPLFLQREAKLYVAFDDTNVFEVPLLEGFSFSQATNVNEVTLSEASTDGVTSRRGTARFTDSLAPAEFSFSTYMRPFKSTGNNDAGNASKGSVANHHAVEEVLWALFAGATQYRTTTNGPVQPLFYSGSASQTANVVITTDDTDSDISFAHSNRVQLHTPDFYISLGRTSDTTAVGANDLLYKLQGAVLNEATVDFDIDGIATINWSGFATLIEDVTGNPETKSFITASSSVVAATVYEGIAATNNFVQNRLSTVTLTNSDDEYSNYEDSYDITLTGGSITFTNNIEYVTPSVMGIVNQPLGHYTGARTISGNLTCYLDGTSGRSADLFEDLAESSTFDVVNFFGLTIKLGGASAPSAQFVIPAAHLEIPTHAVDEVIGMEINFHALPTAGSSGSFTQSISAANEATIKYIGITPDNNIGN